ncbi:MAG: amidinotransferase [Anaerolineae bacterium]|nr:amidinotransferase [Anaerolineae bacterium]
MAAYNEGAPLRQVVVCPPGLAFCGVGADELAAHNFHATVEAAAALEQHRLLREMLTAYGAEVLVLEEPPGKPNAVFVQDVAVGTASGFVRMRMGLPTRESEATWMAAALSARGIPEIGHIEAPGTAEGGDVILAGDVAFVGLSGRTNAEGVRQLSVLLGELGYAVRVIPVPAPSLHLGGVMSVIGPHQIMVGAGVLPDGLLAGFEAVHLPRRDFISGNVITLGPGEVIVEQHNETAITALVRAGIKVHILDLLEFVKGGGGPSCLILPLARGE